MTSQPTATLAPETFACTLTSPEFAARKTRLAETLFATVIETSDLPDGSAYRFPGTAASLAALVDFIAAERECCPFFRFDITVEPHGGPIWLALRGPTGVKAFIDAEFAGLLPNRLPSGSPASSSGA